MERYLLDEMEIPFDGSKMRQPVKAISYSLAAFRNLVHADQFETGSEITYEAEGSEHAPAGIDVICNAPRAIYTSAAKRLTPRPAPGHKKGLRTMVRGPFPLQSKCRSGRTKRREHSARDYVPVFTFASNAVISSLILSASFASVSVFK